MDVEKIENDEASTTHNKESNPTTNLVINRGISLLDSILRFIAIFGTLGSTLAMATTNETDTLPISNQFIQLKAEFKDLPTLMFFVIANAIVCGYLLLSLPLSIFHIIRIKGKTTRIILLIFDTAMLALVTAGASAATAIVYLAHEGNGNANWPAICSQLDKFCERISGSLVGSFAASVLLMLIITTSAIAISRL